MMQPPNQMLLERMAAARAAASSSAGLNGLGGTSHQTRIKAESFQRVSYNLKESWCVIQADRKVKPLCVQLMSLAKLPVTPFSPHAAVIAQLHSAVATCPAEAFSLGFINYLLFPLTQILRAGTMHPSELPPAFLETAFRYMALLVEKWKAVEGGMDRAAREQLWRFVIASAAPLAAPGAGKDTGKGKGKEAHQEVHVERIKVLSSLLMPGKAGEPHPSPAMKAGFSTPQSPLMPSLFQTISYTLSQIHPSTPNLELQLSSLRLLRHLLSLIDSQQNVLASVLPGLVSGVAKLVQAEGTAMKGDVASQAVGAVTDALKSTVSDTVLRQLGVLEAKVTNLADLAEGGIPAPIPDESGAQTNGARDPFPKVTASWLAFTSAQLLSAITPILSTLSTHASHSARSAAADLANALLESCFDSLPDLRSAAITTLLSLSQDEFDPVRHQARRHIRSAMTSHPRLDDILTSILSASINALPRAVTSQQDDKVAHHSRLISAIAEIAAVQTEAGARRNAISDLLGPGGQVERWCYALLDCLEFGRSAGWSKGNAAARAAQLGWGQTFGGSSLLLEDGADRSAEQGDGTDGPGAAFPYTPFRYTESARTAKSLGHMVQLLGRAAGEGGIHAIEYFVQLAESRDDTRAARAPSALWTAEMLLQGLVEGQLEGDEGRVSRKVRKLAKSITRRLVELDEADEQGEGNSGEGNSETSDALLPTERSSGINALSTLLDKPTLKDGYIACETRRLGIEAQRILLTCRSLALLSLCSRILSSSFRPLLMHSLYIVLAQLASPHDIVRSHAERALAHIAYHTGYASPRNMIIDNVDYVVNVVSQRLTPARLAVHAPLVLIAMIRLVGSEIVPLVQDVVVEIFDALDDYHGYEVVGSSLHAVLFG